MINKIFFTEEKGITSTSASALCNYSKECRDALLTKVQRVSFVDEFRDLVGTPSGEKKVRSGISEAELLKFISIAETCAKLDSFNAWFRRAVETKEAWLEEIKGTPDWEIISPIPIPRRPSRINIEEYCERENIVLPKAPERKVITKEVVEAEMNVKEYCRYLSTNASAAIFGKAAHLDGAINAARKEAHNRMASPYDVAETMITHYVPTVSLQTIDSVFTDFQATQRSYDAEHNSMSSRVEKEVSARMDKYAEEYTIALKKYKEDVKHIEELITAEYDKALDQYRKDYADYCEQSSSNLLYCQEWRRKETERVSKLKIIVPEALEEIFVQLNEALHKK